MPIFEYKCSDCGTVFERLEFPGSQEEKECPQCGSRKVIKLLSRFSARSAGGGKIGGSSCSLCSGGSCSTCGS